MLEGLSNRLLAGSLPEQGADGKPQVWYPLLGHLFGFMAIVLLGIVMAQREGNAGLIGICLLILITAGTIGGSIGFLFAIPRVASQIEAAAVAAANAQGGAGQGSEAQAAGTGRRRPLLTTNNNLEKVSDWLTTMLVGVGLTQLGNLDGALLRFRLFLADAAVLYPGRVDRAGLLPAIGPMLLLAGTVVGFVYFYVFTRVVIAPKFNTVERDITGEQRVRSREDAATIKSVAQDLPVDSAATRNVAAASAPSVQDSLTVMQQALYQPNGYLNALKVGDALLGSEAVKRPDYWFFIAAANGQAFSAAADDAAKSAARSRAIEAARRAAEIDPRFRAQLWSISDPAAFDNDLAPFRDDPEFLAIVGRPAPGGGNP